VSWREERILMTSRPKEYLITKRLVTMYKNHQGREKLVCARCDGEIVPGDWIHRSGITHLRIFHQACWEEMIIDLPG
jgi:hypothetical protein